MATVPASGRHRSGWGFPPGIEPLAAIGSLATFLTPVESPARAFVGRHDLASVDESLFRGVVEQLRHSVGTSLEQRELAIGLVDAIRHRGGWPIRTATGYITAVVDDSNAAFAVRRTTTPNTGSWRRTDMDRVGPLRFAHVELPTDPDGVPLWEAYRFEKRAGESVELFCDPNCRHFGIEPATEGARSKEFALTGDVYNDEVQAVLRYYLMDVRIDVTPPADGEITVFNYMPDAQNTYAGERLTFGSDTWELQKHRANGLATICITTNNEDEHGRQLPAERHRVAALTFSHGAHGLDFLARVYSDLEPYMVHQLGTRYTYPGGAGPARRSAMGSSIGGIFGPLWDIVERLMAVRERELLSGKQLRWLWDQVHGHAGLKPVIEQIRSGERQAGLESVVAASPSLWYPELGHSTDDEFFHEFHRKVIEQATATRAGPFSGAPATMILTTGGDIEARYAHIQDADARAHAVDGFPDADRLVHLMGNSPRYALLELLDRATREAGGSATPTDWKDLPQDVWLRTLEAATQHVDERSSTAVPLFYLHARNDRHSETHWREQAWIMIRLLEASAARPLLTDSVRRPWHLPRARSPRTTGHGPR